MRLLFSTLCLVLWCSFLKAQVITIVDKNTNTPLEMVSLFSERPKAFVTTNSQGKADISSFKGAHKIFIQSFGYENFHTSWQQLDSLEFEVALTPSIFDLNEVVISAVRTEQAKEDIAYKITSISPKQIALQQPQTAADALALSGDVFIQKSQQGGGSPMIRGFATNRLLYAVDGVRMNTAIFRSGNIQNVINLDPFAFESVEVLFGGNSVMYGSDAIGGVLSFQTLQPQLSLDGKPLVKGKAVARYASANSEQTFHFDANIGWKRWALLTSFSNWDFGHLKQGSNGPKDYIKAQYVQRIDGSDAVIDQEDELLQIPSGYTQTNLMQKIRYRPNQFWDLQYGFHFSETSDYGRYDRHNKTRNGNWRYGEWSYGPQSWMMNNFSAKLKRSKSLFDEMKFVLAHQQFQESRISRDFDVLDREIREEQVTAYSANLDLSKSLSQKDKLYYGTEYVLNEVNSKGFIENIQNQTISNGPARYPNANWQSLGIYVNNDFKVSEKFTFVAGLRLNQFWMDANFDTTYYPLPFESQNLSHAATTGNIGLIYHPKESLNITANLSTAFRAPNVDDAGKVFDSEPGAVIVPNADLESEYAYNADVGIAKTFGRNLQFELNGYYTYLQNALVRRDFQLGNQDSIIYEGVLSKVQAIQNAAFAEVYGWQIRIQVNLPSGFKLEVKANGQYGVEEDADGQTTPMRHAAPLFGLSRLTYKHKKIQIQAYSVFQGEQSHSNMNIGEISKLEIYALDSNGNTYAPAWYTLNLKAQVELEKLWQLNIGIENITDQRYRPYSSGLSGAGRNLIFGVQLKF